MMRNMIFMGPILRVMIILIYEWSRTTYRLTSTHSQLLTQVWVVGHNKHVSLIFFLFERRMKARGNIA